MRVASVRSLVFLLALSATGCSSATPSAAESQPAVQAPPPPDWEATHARAEQYLRENKPAEAIALLEGVTRQAPDFAMGHLVLAATLVSAAGDRESGQAARTPEQRKLLERAVPHFLRARDLDPQNADLVPLQLLSVYGKDGLDSPADVVRVSREIVARDPESPFWRMWLADVLVEQSRWKEAADVLLEGARLVPVAERVSYAMVVADFARAQSTMPIAQARRLFEAADAVAQEVLARTPDDRDALKLRAGATGMLAERLPAGAERAKLEQASRAAFDRFAALSPRAAPADAEIAFVDPSAKTAPPPPLTKEEERKLFDDGLAAARAGAAADPASDDAQTRLAAYLFDVARDESRGEAERRAAVDEGLRALDPVVKRNAEHLQATTYRGLLLKQSAALQTTPARRDALLAEAGEMLARAEAIVKKRQSTPD